MSNQYAGSGWTPERFNLAVKLWGEGFSAGQIAAELGGFTRNAVIGKLTRAGYTDAGRVKPDKTTKASRNRIRAARSDSVIHRIVTRRSHHTGQAERETTSVKRTEREREAAERRRSFRHGEAVDLTPEETASAVSWKDLRGSHCRWPIGDPLKLDELRFCGAAPHPEKPYCLRHCRLAYVKPDSPKRLQALAVRA